MSLPRFSVRQVVLVNVLFFVCMGAGFVAYLKTPVDFFPNISFNLTAITTVWTGASTQEVERLVTTKIEEEINDVEGVKEIRSVSEAGVSSVLVEWNETLDETEYEASLNDLRAALDRVRDLPPDAEEPVLVELSTGSVWAAMRIPVVDVGGVGETALLEVAREAKRRLERLPGIRSITIQGEHDREVRVVLDRDALVRHDLTATEIVDRLRRRNLNLPAGSLSAGGRETTLRATGDYRSLEELAGTVIRESTTLSHVRLRDVARVESGLEKRRLYGRYNGDPTLILGVVKEEDAHLLEVAREIDAWLSDDASFVPEGIELHKTWDTSVWVRSRMQVLGYNLLAGLGLVAGVLWLTLGFRNALLTVIAVPFSFLTAMVLFPILGLTINSISLIGMLLVSGMLVDDAIIILENIYRRIEGGEALQEAVVNGAEEVLWPVVSAVATTCAAFVPLLLVTGTSGEFMKILPQTVIVCLVASLFECLVVLPAHYLEWGSRAGPGSTGAPGRVDGLRRVLVRASSARIGVDRGIRWLRTAYLRALDVVLVYRGSFALLGVALFFLSLGVASHLEVDLFPTEYDNFWTILEAPADYSLEETDEVYRGIETVFASLVGEDLVDYSTFSGMAVSASRDVRRGSNLAISYLTMVDSEEYRLQPEVAVQRVQEHLDAYRKENPEGIVELQAMTPRPGPPLGKPVALRIETDDYDRAKSIATEVKAYLRSIPGVLNVEDNLVEGPTEVRLRIDDTRAGFYGLSFEDVAEEFQAANDGIVASSFRAPGDDEEIDIRVLFDERFRRSVREILRAPVRAPDGQLVRLADVSDLEVSRGFLSLAHYDGQRTVTVYADVDRERATSESVNRRLQVRLADVPVQHPDVHIVYGGEFEATREAFADLGRVFPIALLLIYMILAALFRSYVQPVIVVTAIPFGLMGVIAGVALLGYKVSFPMLYATMGLTGVVVNDSLVMVDFINRARRSGVPLLEAVRQSGAVRLRPILLTTITTVLALLPMALGLHGGSRSYGPFAASIVFGLIVAMVGTLFAVPLTYTSLATWIDRVARWRGEGRAPQSPRIVLHEPRPSARGLDRIS